METIEPFGSFDDVWRPTAHSVSLKDGIDTHLLSRGEGTTFEIDVSQSLPPNVEEEEVFDKEEVYKHLNSNCIGIEGDSASDSEDAMTPFERMAVGMEDLVGDGGVLKKTIRPGTGPLVPEGAMVRVHYNGYLEFADEPYDSSRLRNRQQQFQLGKGEVIPGWEVGLASMQRTELARFLIRSEYAFGEMGCPPRIPPNATIMFEIELINFVDHQAADAYASLSREDREQATVEQLIAVANVDREAGNDLFQQKYFGRAAGKYHRAIRLLENVRLKNEEEECQWKEVLVKLYLNLCLCNLRQKKSKPVITYCKKALELDPQNIKAHFRLGQAYMQLSEFDKSRTYLIKAGQLFPGNAEIRQELEKLDRAVKKFKAMEKSMCSKMFHFTPASKTNTSTAGSPASTETERLFKEKLSAFKANQDMMELVLPASLEPEEIACAEEVAKDLELQTELGSHGIRITKPGVTEDGDIQIPS